MMRNWPNLLALLIAILLSSFLTSCATGGKITSKDTAAKNGMIFHRRPPIASEVPDPENLNQVHDHIDY